MIPPSIGATTRAVTADVGRRASSSAAAASNASESPSISRITITGMRASPQKLVAGWRHPTGDVHGCTRANTGIGPLAAAAFHGGCRTKPSAKTRRALAEVHARAAVRDDLATDRALATDEMADFGTHP